MWDDLLDTLQDLADDAAEIADDLNSVTPEPVRDARDAVTETVKEMWDSLDW